MPLSNSGLSSRLYLGVIDNASEYNNGLVVPEENRIKRLGTVIDPPDVLSLTGDVESGRQLFMSEAASQCKNCHRINEKGDSIGPDLGKIGEKYKLHELLESLVQPSKKIEEKYSKPVKRPQPQERHNDNFHKSKESKQKRRSQRFKNRKRKNFGRR